MARNRNKVHHTTQSKYESLPASSKPKSFDGREVGLTRWLSAVGELLVAGDVVAVFGSAR